ncbi:hypothetical protein BD626DRAFT_634954 [Schizophyllum amplum]|uniref:Uncharacterized protein n=1 Tax=Schizophyllum amplum TaxID=97359 RepID=A0A550BXQ4_9AGAR|nr:hypothetical protein BD626DRAFT_634954 [Auriculariopsis ampla]
MRLASVVTSGLQESRSRPGPWKISDDCTLNGPRTGRITRCSVWTTAVKTKTDRREMETIAARSSKFALKPSTLRA